MCSRYAIGHAERSGPMGNIGWLAELANATDQPYNRNNTGGPSIKVINYRLVTWIQVEFDAKMKF